jgi:hypothetical protein
VADCQEGTLKRIDTRSGTITATIATGIANPKGELNVVEGAGSIWVASDEKAWWRASIRAATGWWAASRWIRAHSIWPSVMMRSGR